MNKKNFELFFDEMAKNVPPHARIVSCQFRGDPNADIKGKWRARVVSGANGVDDGANVYLCVSAMQRNERGEFRRRKENFAGGLLLMIDDLGDGPGAKFPLSLIAHCKPTALIETSPDNYQAVYMFKELVDDLELFDALIRAFIQEQFLEKDTGMAGVNRVFRPPVGVNGKPKYGGWNVKLAEWNPEFKYTVQELAEAFNLNLERKVYAPKAPLGREDMQDRIGGFIAARAQMRSAGMLKEDEPDYAGWVQVTCPWVDDHTDGADTGSAIRVPSDENGFYGAYRCHHGHCQEKSWSDVTQWLAEHAAELLEAVNDSAFNFDTYKFDEESES